MKYCPSCGSQVPTGVSFCPNCGTKVENNNQTNNQPSNNYVGGAPRVENRDLAVAIILSIVTCGIYGIIWYVNIVNDTNTICNDENSNQSGGMVLLLTIITCGIYGIIWFYQAGKRLATAGQKYGMQISDNSLVYLVLHILGLGIVNYCLVQADLNKFSGQ